MVDKIKGAEVVIGGDSRGAEVALDKVTKQVNRLGRLAKVAIAAFATHQVASLFNTMVTGAQGAIDQMSKMARQTDGTTIGIQALRRAADLSGVSIETLTQSAKQLNVSIGEMTTRGTGPAVEALKRLGITAEELSGLDIDQKFGLIADRMKGLNLTAAEQQSLLQQLRIEHATVQNLLEGGSEVFKNARKDVHDFGQAISDVDAAQIEAANDAMTSFGEVMSGIANQMAIALAPILKGIAGEFDDMARGAVNFRTTFENAIDGVVGAIGVVLDTVALWKLRWNQLTSFITDSIQGVVDGLDSIRTGIEDVIEKIPGMSGHFSEMRKRAEEDNAALKESMKQVADVAEQELREALGGEFPSEGLQRWLQEAREASRLAAEAAVESNRVRREQAAQTTTMMSDEQRKQLEAQQIAAQTSLDALRNNLLTKEELELQSYQRRLEQLIAFREQGLLTEQQYNEFVRRAHQDHNDRMNEIQAASVAKSHQLYAGLAGQVSGLMGTITSAIGTEGKKQFGIVKALSLAQAILKGYESIVSSYAAGARIGGPPLGAAYAAIAAASTAAQIASLRSTTATSSGGGGSAGTSSAAAASAPQGVPQTLTVQGIDPGQLYSGDAVRSIAESLLDYQRDGGRVILQ